MSAQHCGLIVEDHPETAQDLAEILRSMDCEATIVTSRDAALRYLNEHRPCAVLLDLSIPASENHIKGRPNVGIELLGEIRRRFGSKYRQEVWLPVIVVSGHANEVDQAVELMKLEADDVIRKPYKEKVVVATVREALVRSGRETHRVCSTALVASGKGITVHIPGRSAKRRAVIILGWREVHLTDTELQVLLALLRGRVDGRPTPMENLAANKAMAYKRADHLRKAIAGVVGDATTFVRASGGSYELAEDVEVGSIDFDWLTSHGNAEIARLGIELENAVRERS